MKKIVLTPKKKGTMVLTKKPTLKFVPKARTTVKKAPYTA